MKKLFLLFAVAGLLACQNTAENLNITDETPTDTINMGMHPKWTQHAAIYEVNIRQHTPQGTINAFREKLPELKELGVNILWIMPIQPIGIEKRKGGLGSYYSIKDYTAVNPEFGTMEDFKRMVQAAHDVGFKVILDWVANHSAWDNVWMKDNPDWYTKKNGKIVAPVDDWSDVADLNYDNADMRRAMKNAMKFWVNETNIDGFRCDVAMMVPMDFWEDTRMALDSIKPVFMLAEAEGPEYHTKAFDMTYGWEFHHILNEVAKGEMDASHISGYLAKMDTTYPEGALRMYFTTNHDENSWNGTIFERMPNDYQAMYVLSSTLPNAIPLVYSGQEYGLNKRLAFFEKDTITGSDSTLFDFYKKVVTLKMNHPTLQNGQYQGDFQPLPMDTSAPRLYGYTREKDGQMILVLLNFSDEAGIFNLPEKGRKSWTSVLSGSEIVLSEKKTMSIPAHNYMLLKSN